MFYHCGSEAPSPKDILIQFPPGRFVNEVGIKKGQTIPVGYKTIEWIALFFTAHYEDMEHGKQKGKAKVENSVIQP